MRSLTATCVRIGLAALLAAMQLTPEAAAKRAGNGTRTSISGNRDVEINGGHRGDTNINVDVDRGWNNGPWDDHWHPVGTAVAVGATVAVTRAIVGTRVYVLPSTSCVIQAHGATTYYVCDDDWYAPQYYGTQITYVVVRRPY